VARRAAPAVLVVSGALANLLGRPDLGSLLLLAAVPVCAWCALATLGELLDAPGSPAAARLQALLAGGAASFVVVACAARGTALASSALVVCLAAAMLQALLGAGSEVALERERIRRVAGEVDQRLHEHERADRDADAEQDGRAQQPLRRRRAA
jgi:hypothetical protein